tara:strand:- start:57 stop:386 length:330 start_codon:yes stop_codon:yes gene_type:complete
MLNKYDNKGNFFFVEVIPNIDNKGQWDGQYELAIQARRQNINDESFYELEQVCQMTCAAITMMEENEDFRETVYKFLNSPDSRKIKQKSKLPINKTNGNIINVDFKNDV